MRIVQSIYYAPGLYAQVHRNIAQTSLMPLTTRPDREVSYAISCPIHAEQLYYIRRDKSCARARARSDSDRKLNLWSLHVDVRIVSATGRIQSSSLRLGALHCDDDAQMSVRRMELSMRRTSVCAVCVVMRANHHIFRDRIRIAAPLDQLPNEDSRRQPLPPHLLHRRPRRLFDMHLCDS